MTSAKVKFAFAGHQTFPLRQLWPHKAYLYAQKLPELKTEPNFSVAKVMRLLGVGANMVDALKFWARACGVLNSDDSSTALADLLFAQANGLDPFCEDPTTLWLLHWNIACSAEKLTTLWFIFNLFTKNQFTKDDVLKELKEFLDKQLLENNIKRLPSDVTLNRDIDTILRSYAPKYSESGRLKLKGAKLDNSEDAVDALFRELNLIGSTQQGFYFNRGQHQSLSPYIFAYCYIEFWQTQELSPTIDLNKIAYQAGAPGRVFKLDELTLEDYLMQLEELTDGKLRWMEQTGLRQVVCSVQSTEELTALKGELLRRAYHV